ncbi:helix-turn-helix transcriptional regulator [Miniphocaeibacter massiliensis]|uniref:helix-turn-helix transcriptional regulator n=1 Tax=Miniphocaeibacter massiliensis TaxID=2041841 RepID=UPI000C087961|nr:AraC family transcriptional regulator [Miniphocaeibacter massiliensis]
MEILENQLIRAVLIKDRDKARTLSESIVRYISENSASFEYFKSYLVQFNGIFYWNTIKNITDFEFTNSILKERNNFLLNILNTFDMNSLNKVFERMIDFYTASQNELIYNCKNSLVKTMLIYIYNNCNQKISLDLLACTFHLSKSYVSNLISRHVSISLPIILLNFRMEKAKTLLIDSNLPINEISKLSGFDSTSYFCHQFKNVHNLTPKQFRAKNYKNI